MNVNNIKKIAPREKIKKITPCEQQCGKIAEVYAMDRYAGGWGGNYCQPCADALRFVVTDVYDTSDADA